MAPATKKIPDGFHTVTPQLVLDPCADAIEWYKKAFGAREIARALGPDGKIMHADVQIGHSRVFMNDPVMGSKSPQALGGSPVSLWLYVEDVDALFDRAVAAGAKAQMPVADQFWGDRMGHLSDPFGYSWSIATHTEDLTPDEIRTRQAEFMKQFAPTGR